MFKGVRTIILDYDGTLHDSTQNYIHAFKQAYAFLVEAGHAAPRDWADAEITKWLGYSSKAMWENFMPDLDEEVRSKASKMIGQILLEKAQTGQAILYEGALETLQALKEKGYRLVFLSNCSRAYMEAHRESFGLDRYFDGMYCTEDFSFIPKYEIFESIRAVFPWRLPDCGRPFPGHRSRRTSSRPHSGLPLRLRFPRGTGLGGCTDRRYPRIE